MTFRGRLTIGGLVVAWLPVLGLGLLLRSEAISRLEDASERRVADRTEEIAENWNADLAELEARLAFLQDMLREDIQSRTALRRGDFSGVQQMFERLHEADDFAYLLGAGGQILVASHFPGDRGRTSPELTATADAASAPLIATVPFPSGDTLALIRSERLAIADTLTLLVGSRLNSIRTFAVGTQESLWATPESGNTVDPSNTSKRWLAGDNPTATPEDQDHLPQPIAQVLWLGWSQRQSTTLVKLVVEWQDPLRAAIVASFDRVLIFSLLGSAALALLLGHAMAKRLSRPVERISAAARSVHLGRLDVSFGRGGGRELDRLGFFLTGMLNRIREGLAKVRDAEKRATTGELARQVNHDVRNGLIPIRNVVKHLTEAGRDGPMALAEAFAARSGTLTGSLDYLGDLADQYRAVATHGQRESTDLCEIARSVLETSVAWPAGVQVVHELGGCPAYVEIDSLALRRVIENLITNAVAAVEPSGGSVTVRVEKANENGQPTCRLSVSDNGPGIPEELRARVFEPFFTTRTEGTGLGLVIVRRLVRDVGGKIVIEDSPEGGTNVIVTLNQTTAPTHTRQE